MNKDKLKEILRMTIKTYQLFETIPIGELVGSDGEEHEMILHVPNEDQISDMLEFGISEDNLFHSVVRDIVRVVENHVKETGIDLPLVSVKLDLTDISKQEDVGGKVLHEHDKYQIVEVSNSPDVYLLKYKLKIDTVI